MATNEVPFVPEELIEPQQCPHCESRLETHTVKRFAIRFQPAQRFTLLCADEAVECIGCGQKLRLAVTFASADEVTRRIDALVDALVQACREGHEFDVYVLGFNGAGKPDQRPALLVMNRARDN